MHQPFPKALRGVTNLLKRVWPLAVLMLVAAAFARSARTENTLSWSWLSLKTSRGEAVHALLSSPNPRTRRPIAVVVCDDSYTMLEMGRDLRRFADLDFVAIGIVCRSRNIAGFSQEFRTLTQYIAGKAWARNCPTVWVATGATSALLKQYYLIRIHDLHKHRVQDVNKETIELFSTQYRLSEMSVESLRLFANRSENSGRPPLAVQLPPNGEIPTAALLSPDEKWDLTKAHEFRMSILAEICHNTISQTSWRTIPKPSNPSCFGVCLSTAVGIAVVFWLLAWSYRCQQRDSSSVGPRLIRWRAIVVAGSGIILGAVIVGVGMQITLASKPSGWNIAFVRKLLIRPSDLGYFDFVLGESKPVGLPLGSIVEEVHLGSRARKETFGAAVGGHEFSCYILSDRLGAAFDGHLDWRGPLWRFFYPRVKTSNSTVDAASIVVLALRERIMVDPRIPESSDVGQLWKAKRTSLRDFDFIYVAALRSIGIAARVGKSGKAELLIGERWKLAPRPPIEAIPKPITHTFVLCALMRQ
jgi:hypothetical protein